MSERFDSKRSERNPRARVYDTRSYASIFVSPPLYTGLRGGSQRCGIVGVNHSVYQHAIRNRVRTKRHPPRNPGPLSDRIVIQQHHHTNHGYYHRRRRTPDNDQRLSAPGYAHASHCLQELQSAREQDVRRGGHRNSQLDRVPRSRCF